MGLHTLNKERCQAGRTDDDSGKGRGIFMFASLSLSWSQKIPFWPKQLEIRFGQLSHDPSDTAFRGLSQQCDLASLSDALETVKPAIRAL